MESNNNWDIYLGVAAEDKELPSRVLKVLVKELQPFFVGLLEKRVDPQEFTFFDDIPEADAVGMTNTTNVITADWFSLHTNRAYPPDIRKGEQVLVFKLRDNDLYYWVSMGRDDNLRRLERHRIWVSDDLECQKELTDENTYYFELDTLYNQRIRWVTNKSNGEDFKYEITIDAKNDFIVLQDDIGNQIILQSPVPRVRCKNSAGSFVDVIGPDVNIFAPNNITLTAGNNIIHKAGVNIESTAGTDIKNTAGVNTINVAGTMIENKTPYYHTVAKDKILEESKVIGNVAEEKHVREAPEIGDNSGLHVIDTGTLGVTGVINCSGMVSSATVLMGPLVESPGPASPGPIEL